MKDTGSFLIVLPEAEQIGETVITPDDDSSGIEVLVSMYLKDGAMYRAGYSALALRVKEQPDGVWKDFVKFLDAEEVKKWYEDLESDEALPDEPDGE